MHLAVKCQTRILKHKEKEINILEPGLQDTIFLANHIQILIGLAVTFSRFIVHDWKVSVFYSTLY